MNGKTTYKDAGVDIDAKERLLERAKGAIRRSFTPGVLGDVGLFGGLFDPARVGFQDAILVATADGVGTKLEVARRARVYDTVGWDLVNHCIDDALVQGARPLFFLDYVAMGKREDAVKALREAKENSGKSMFQSLLIQELSRLEESPALSLRDPKQPPVRP